MRAPDLRLSFLALVGALCAAQIIQPPDVVDRALSNGIRVLMVERPGMGAVRAGLFIQGGRAATGNLSPAAADLLAASLFRRHPSLRLEKELELPLRQEGTAFEALRLERLRQARRPDRAPSPELPGIQELYRNALLAIQEKMGPGDGWDEVDALGGTRRSWEVEADSIAFGIDLPAAHLESWCRLMARQLASPFLGRFPLERERLLQGLDAGEPPCAPSLSVLLSTALAGRPYAQASEFQRSDVEALTLADLTALGRRLLVPDRLVLVLVGEVKAPALMPALEATFGTLGKGQAPVEAPAAFKDDDPRSSLESPAGRRLLVSTTGETRVLFGWRVPPANHPDGPALRILAHLLAGSASSRLNANLVASRGLARSLTLTAGVPGDRDVNLLIIDAEPAPGHSLGELEQAIEGEVLRLQREPLPEAEVRRAQKQLESLQVQWQEDAGVLARTLGVAQCQGDWRLPFQALAASQSLRPPEIQAAARTYLVPARMTIAQFGPDPLLLPRDRIEGRLLQVLSTLVQRRISDPVAAQNVLREALRQLRMLSSAEREQTLKLLEAQVAP